MNLKLSRWYLLLAFLRRTDWSDTMKDKDEQTALIGMAIGAAVISLVATQKQINQGSIVDELVRLGRQKGDGVEDEVFVQAARLVSKGT